MNHHVQNKLKMYKAVVNTCTINASDWNSLLAFGDTFNSVRVKIDDVEALILEQATRLSGVRAHKDKRKKEIIDNMKIVAGRLIAYAKVTGNVLLKEQVKFSPSKLKTGAEARLLQFLDIVLQKAQEQVGNLGTYGVTQQAIDELAAERTELNQLLGSVRSAIIERREFTLAIRNSMKEIDGILKEELDKLAVTLKAVSPKFCERYKAARDITKHKAKAVKPVGNLPDAPQLPLHPHSPGGLIPGND